MCEITNQNIHLSILISFKLFITVDKFVLAIFVIPVTKKSLIPQNMILKLKKIHFGFALKLIVCTKPTKTNPKDIIKHFVNLC